MLFAEIDISVSKAKELLDAGLVTQTIQADASAIDSLTVKVTRAEEVFASLKEPRYATWFLGANCVVWRRNTDVPILHDDLATQLAIIPTTTARIMYAAEYADDNRL